MDSFDVVISPKALGQLDAYIDYIQHTLLNPKAAENVWRDALATGAQLSTVAGSLALCKNPALQDLGYRCIAFQSHRYIMLYRVVDTTAYVDAVYHMQQDYENILASELYTQN
jgi:plasmid stabilization system protein ParE